MTRADRLAALVQDVADERGRRVHVARVADGPIHRWALILHGGPDEVVSVVGPGHVVELYPSIGGALNRAGEHVRGRTGWTPAELADLDDGEVHTLRPGVELAPGLPRPIGA